MATKTKRRKGLSRNSESLKEIRRHWGDLEVVDAGKDLRVFIQPEDVRSATVKDPGCCVFAQACKRQFAASKVLFWRSVAYVELPGPDGKRRVERFILSPQMRDLIENFDKGNPVADVAGFELKKPRPSSTFAGKIRKNRAWKEKRRKALLNGTALGSRRCTPGGKKGAQGDGKYSKPALVVDLEVRDGKGRVQFRNTPAAV
jgi:hypothetical protein